MFLINVQFRPARSKNNISKPGVVFYKITGRPSFGDGERLERNVNSDIHGIDKGVIKTERDKVLSQIRLLYCIIEKRELSGVDFSADNVTEDFRKALAGDDSMVDVIAKSKTNFPFRRGIVNINRRFQESFEMIYTLCETSNEDSMTEYITNLSLNLKNENRISQSRNFLSLLSNLLAYVHEEDVYFSRIDCDFIREYAEWLKRTGVAESTQSFYLRTFRAVLNKAQADGLIYAPAEWFADVNTKIYPSANNTDTNLSRELLLKIRDLNLTDDEPMAMVRDLFMFGYYCGGMELVDIVNLNTDNLSDNVLKYRRRLKGKETSVVLGEQAQAILSRYKTDHVPHLFPILDKSGGITFSRVRQIVGYGMKVIGKLVGHPDLTFSMNIKAYKSILSGISISEFLLNHS